MTRIIIAHRPETISSADRVINLNQEKDRDVMFRLGGATFECS
jgi:ABC-type bacteriocin/lantibiotic exporter with double-glycine peptidase domain